MNLFNYQACSVDKLTNSTEKRMKVKLEFIERSVCDQDTPDEEEQID